jgi:two-component system, OmpR family, response regulator
MLPATLALVDDDPEFREFLAQHLRDQGVAVSAYADSNDLLASDGAYGHDFYLLDLGLPGVDGIELIKVLRKRTQAGVLVVSGRLGPDVFRQIVDAGADMYLVKPVQFEQVALAVRAVQRRAVQPASPKDEAWRLNRAAAELQAPDGARVPLSDTDLQVLQCLLEARGETVTRDALRQRLGRVPSAQGDDGLNAIIYRLRRRIERATPLMVPLQSRSRVGYVFKAPLVE